MDYSNKNYLSRYFSKETDSEKIKKTPHLIYDPTRDKTLFVNFDILDLSSFDILNSSQLSDILTVNSTFISNNIIISFYDKKLITKTIRCCEKYKDIVRVINYNEDEIELEPMSPDVFPVEIIILSSKHGHLKNIQYILMDGEQNADYVSKVIKNYLLDG